MKKFNLKFPNKDGDSNDNYIHIGMFLSAMLLVILLVIGLAPKQNMSIIATSKKTPEPTEESNSTPEPTEETWSKDVLIEPNRSDIDGSGQVVKVVDGDTIDVLVDGVTTRIRIAQINTPESVAPEEYTEKTGKENGDKGKIASDYAKEKLDGKVVYYEFCTEDTDEYGRKLAYIYLDKYAVEMYEADILMKGYAELISISPNEKYTKYLKKYEDIASGMDEGFWKDGEYNGNEQKESE